MQVKQGGPMQLAEKEFRPWTVYVLIGLSALGTVWSLVADSDRTMWDLAGVLVNVGVAYLMWTGRGWVFTLLFMLTSLCAAGLVVVLLVEAFLLERGLHTGALSALAASVIWMFLLLHPATKAFAGLRNN